VPTQSGFVSTSISKGDDPMPLRKLRSLKEAEEAVWFDRNDPRLTRAIRGLWDFSFRLSPRRYPPGVFKFRSIEEKNRFDEAQRRVNVEAQQRRLRDSARR
jgi:lipopolysaccharide/colanic/teichoic acid biosynthesis glycosyltransferase